MLDPLYEEHARLVAAHVADRLLQMQPVIVPEYLDPDEAAIFLNVPVRTLQNWRCRSDGPPFHRFGNTVRYTTADLRAWMASHRHEGADHE